jgi:hypothetical protein
MYTPVIPDPEQVADGSTVGAEKKAPRPRGWVSLGSEAEIDMEMVRPTREKVFLMFLSKDSCSDV